MLLWILFIGIPHTRMHAHTHTYAHTLTHNREKPVDFIVDSFKWYHCLIHDVCMTSVKVHKEIK